MAYYNNEPAKNASPGYPINYDINYQAQMGQPANPYQNPQQYPYDPYYQPPTNQINNNQMNNPQVLSPQVIVIETGYVKSRPTIRSPEVLFCSRCQKTGISRVSFQVGGGAWIMSLLLFCFGCYICCFIPCCIEDCLDCVHDCSSCGSPLGRINYLMD